MKTFKTTSNAKKGVGECLQIFTVFSMCKVVGAQRTLERNK